MTFTKRDLASHLTLGQRLRQLREESNFTLEGVAKELRVAPKYIQAIENGRYSELPGLVYARSFCRQYVNFVGLNPDSAMERFDQEYALIATTKQPLRPLPPARVSTEHHWLRRHGRLIVAGVVIFIVVSYVGGQVYRVFAPPRLIVIQPAADLSTTEDQIRVSGQTEPNVIVAINGQSVAVSAAGQFSELVDVSAGLNTLRITATKKHSQPRVVIRQVLVEK